MKRRSTPAPATRVAPVRATHRRQLRQAWRETWDSMSLAGQIRITLLAVVTLTILLVQFILAAYAPVATYFQTRERTAQISARILQRDVNPDTSAILANVQAQPGVIAAALQLPAGDVLWTYDRNAPDVDAGASADPAPVVSGNQVAWYERHRLEADLHQKLTYVAADVPLAANLQAQLSLLIATPSAWHVAQRHLVQLPFMLVFGWALALLAARRLSRQVVVPLTQLALATRVEGLPGQDPATAGRRGNELTRIAANFDALVDRLAANERDMRNVRFASRQEILERTRDLEMRLNKAELQARSKDEFLANMSHEIRTPMNGVLGMAELLAGTTLDDRQRRYVDSMREAAGTMMQIINDILDDAKIVAGKMDLVCEPFEVRDLIEQTAQLYAGRAETKKLELSCQVEPGVPAVVIGDALRLRQVLGNLLSNAVKYTEHGEIQVRVGVDDLTPGSQCRLHFRVSDTGPGIAASHHATIFEAFAQLDNATRIGGTGLGLSIATGLVRLLGGERIELHSQVGHGSAFSFALPFEIAESDPVVASPEFQGLRAAIVDDMATSYMALREVLTSWGVDVTVITSGRALDNVVSSAARVGRPFDVILLDHALPDATTEDLLRAIRLESIAPETYVALLSAFDFEPRQIGGRAIRPDVCLAKPVRQQQLRNLLRTVHAVRDGTATNAPGTPAMPVDERLPGLGLSVLVVDDNMINREVASAILEQFSCRVVVAEDGQAAVQRARAARFDVILMDCQMPVMDGYAATAAIRREEGARGTIPTTIVALTANALQRDRERCLAAGMDAFLAKPFTQAQLAQVLRPIAEARGTLLPPRPAEPVAPAARPEARPVTLADPACSDDEFDLTATATITLLDMASLEGVVASAAPVLDEEQVHTIRGLGQPKIFERLCDMLFASAPEALCRIGAAIDAGDLDATGAAAHGLKSAVNNLGGRRLAEQLDQLESAVLEQADLQTVRRAAAGLEQAYAQFETALRGQFERSTGT